MSIMQAAECLSRYRGESTPGISDSWLVLAGRRVGGQEYGKNGPAPALFRTAPKTQNAIMAPHDVSAHPKPEAGSVHALGRIERFKNSMQIRTPYAFSRICNRNEKSLPLARAVRPHPGTQNQPARLPVHGVD